MYGERETSSKDGMILVCRNIGGSNGDGGYDGTSTDR